MAEAVVDVFEVIKVDEHYGEVFICATAVIDCLTQSLLEQTPIGKSSQRIMESLMLELLLEFIATGVVVTGHGEPGSGLVLKTGCGHFDKSFFAAVGD